MDNAFNLSSTKIIQVIAEAEVMSIFFPRVGKALIVDTRYNPEAAPTVFVDEMAGSPQDRLDSIRRLRPQFKELAQLTLAPWVGSTRSFAEQGLLDAVVARFHSEGFPETADEARVAFHQMQRFERATLRALIEGDPQTTRTIFARQG